MDAVFAKTRELGQALIESEAYQNMKSAEERAYRNADAAEAMGRYLELKNRIDSVMSQADADPEEISRYGREMDELQQQLNAMPAVDAMTTSRQKFSELMNQVNRVLEFIITGEVAQEGGCTGNCSSCGGCH